MKLSDQELDHRAKAFQPMLDALEAAEPYIELVHSLSTSKESRRIVWRKLEAIREAIKLANQRPHVPTIA